MTIQRLFFKTGEQPDVGMSILSHGILRNTPLNHIVNTLVARKQIMMDVVDECDSGTAKCYFCRTNLDTKTQMAKKVVLFESD